MKTSRSQSRWQRTDGSILLTAAIAAAILGIMVVSYLSWVTNEYRFAKRSNQWAQALNLAESAVEDGLAELNFRYPAGNGFQTANGWASLGGGSSYQKTVTSLTDANGQVVGSYSVTVSNQAGWFPVILGVGTTANLSGTNVSRAINVVVKKKNKYALIAKTGISFTNPSFLVDSYDSSDPTKSTGGLYDASKQQPNAVMGILGGSMALKGDVYGILTLSGGGMVSQIGTVGNTFNLGLRANNIITAIARNYIVNAPAPPMSTPTLPFSTGSATYLGAITSTYTFPSGGDYYADSVKGSLNITNAVRLYVIGDIQYSGQGITVPTGSSLELYVGGAITMSGSSFINNANASPNCYIFGLAASTWSLTGSSGITALLYAPDVDIKFTGGTVLSGQMVGNSFSTTGAGAFHYDEALNGSVAAYKVLVWQEYRKVAGSWVP